MEETKRSVKIDMQKLRDNGIFVATPMYGGACVGKFTHSMINLAVICAQNNIPFTTHFILNESLIQRGRNFCADEFLRRNFRYGENDEPRPFKHLIFIDSDIEFNPQDVIVLAHLQNEHDDYDVIGGTYPKKKIAWKNIKAAVDAGYADDDPANLRNFAGEFVFSALKQGQARLDEPIEVAELGTGFMMIRRETLEKLEAAYPQYRYKPDQPSLKNFDGSRYIHAFFNCEIDPKTERYLSEDYFFCHKVREAGMKVMLAPWVQLTHHGYMEYGGSLSALAALGQSATST